MSTIKANYTQETGSIRIYENYVGRLTQYDAIVSVTWVGRDRVCLHGAHGRMNKAALIAIAEELIKFGARSATMCREDMRRMPCARLVTRHDGLSEWCVDDIHKFIKDLGG